MISVLIVNHNGATYLERCLTSIERGSGSLSGELEVVVADNGSTDGSLQMLRQRTDVTLLELGANVGFGEANNRAAAVARGDTLLLLNSDAWLLSGALELLAEAIQRDPRCGLAAPTILRPDGTPEAGWVPEVSVLGEALQVVRNHLPSRLGYGGVLERLLRACTRGWFTAACCLVRRPAFDAVGGFDSGFFLYFEDADLCRRLRLAGWSLCRVGGAKAVHVGGGSTEKRGGPHFERIAVEYRRSQLRYYRKHRPRWEQDFLERRLRNKFRGTPMIEALGLGPAHAQGDHEKLS